MLSMLFQTVGVSRFGAQFAYLSDRFGLWDVFLPFLLIFAIIFAIVSQIEPFKKKSIAVTISLVISLLFLFPHFAGIRPDPVSIIASAIPSITVIAVAFLMLLILLGVVGMKQFGGLLKYAAVIFSLFAVIYFFLLGAGYVPSLWLSLYLPFLLDPQVIDLLIIILVFGLIVWFVVSEPAAASTESVTTRAKKALKDVFED